MTEAADETHGILGDWRSLDQYINPAADRLDGHGVLMQGPGRIVKIMATRLQSAGLEVSLLPSRRPTRRLRVMLLETSYVVAEQFRFEESSPAGHR